MNLGDTQCIFDNFVYAVFWHYNTPHSVGSKFLLFRVSTSNIGLQNFCNEIVKKERFVPKSYLCYYDLKLLFQEAEIMYYAHIREDGRKQTVEQHLEGTAERCALFASAFGEENRGKLLGYAHDIGKTSQEFQKRLLGGPKIDHATAGALECAKEEKYYSKFCVRFIGHIAWYNIGIQIPQR